MASDARRRAVLAYFEARFGEWVEGPALISETVGGTEGLRRLRELRDRGYRIEKERIPGRDAFRYRMIGRPGDANPDKASPLRASDD